MSNPFDWEHDSASEGLSSLAADLGIDKTANLGELKSRLSVGIDHYGCIHGTVVRGEDSEEREIYLRGNIRQRMIKTLYRAFRIYMGDGFVLLKLTKKVK